MNPWTSRSTRLTLAGALLFSLGLTAPGCGGGDVPDPDADSAAAAPEAAASAPAPAAAAAGSETAAAAEPAATSPAASQSPAPAAASAASPPAAAPAGGDAATVVADAGTSPVAAATKGDSSATEEMLRVTGNAPAPAAADAGAGQAGAAVAANSPPAAGQAGSQPGAFPGAPGGAGAPGAGYPGSQAGGQAGAQGGQAGAQAGRGRRGGVGVDDDGPGMPAAPGGPGGPGAPGIPGGQGGPGFPGGPGGDGGGADLGSGPADFTSPRGAVTSFLRALRAKDKDQLITATALRAPKESAPKNQKLFSSITEQSISEEEMGELAKAFEGYAIRGNVDAMSTAKMAVPVQKTGPNGEYMERAIYVRKEKEGWKVVDFSVLRVQKSISGSRGKTGRGR